MRHDRTLEKFGPIKAASPCSARWADMTGDDQCRFCDHCRKHVYKFSTMQADEVERLIIEKEGKLCARFYQRADGTILTANCPVAVDRLVRRVKLAVCSFAAFFVIGCGVLVATSGPDARNRAARRVEVFWNEATWKVKGLLGIKRPAPMPLLGEICVPPSRLTPPPQNSAN